MKKVYAFLISLCLILSVFFFINYKKTHNDLEIIKEKGILTVGTTGDYCPMSCYDKTTNTYIGFDIALAEDLAKSLNVKIKYIPTSWPTLMQDIKSKKFDIAISGITITNERKKQAFMTDGYLDNGKTVLCQKKDIDKYKNLEAINKPSVRVMENPGGLNEKFARENLPDSNLIIHNINYEIPKLIAEDKADVMITEVIEANYYSNIYKNLAIPVSTIPFTKSEIGMLLPKENKTLLKYVNKFIREEKNSGRLLELEKTYIQSKKPLINHN